MNILDPAIRVGDWSNEEQEQIFALMQEHLTSWSTICKQLRGRTENSIKNYFYSTVRRIQALPVLDFFCNVKTNLLQHTAVRSNTTWSVFEEKYELKKLNRLGFLVCKHIYEMLEENSTTKPLFEYLLYTVADDNKLNKIKPAPPLPLPFHPSPSFSSIDVRMLLHNLSSSTNLQVSVPEEKKEKPDVQLGDFSDISIPIPSRPPNNHHNNGTGNKSLDKSSSLSRLVGGGQLPFLPLFAPPAPQQAVNTSQLQLAINSELTHCMGKKMPQISGASFSVPQINSHSAGQCTSGLQLQEVPMKACSGARPSPDLSACFEFSQLRAPSEKHSFMNIQ